VGLWWGDVNGEDWDEQEGENRDFETHGVFLNLILIIWGRE
jgi:hypothetical protein